MHNLRRRVRYFLPICVLILSGCSEDVPPRPLAEVVVDDVVLVPYQPNASFVGRLQAVDDVRIQAQISGFLKARHFKDGELIAKGALLYEIDPAHYKASLAKAKADTAKARAAQQVAELNLKRGKNLAPQGAISASEIDKLTATKLQADADLQAALANLESAEVDLSYTRIVAPITGRIGKSALSVGDLVSPESGTLTSLVSINPMMASFRVSESIYLMGESRRRDLKKMAGDVGDIGNVTDMTVTLELSNREIYPHAGKLDYVANRIDEDTGTIEARAVIPNPDSSLLPGQYVKVMLAVPFTIDTLMVPQAAVQADQQGSFVLEVGPDSTVIRRNVVLDDRVGERVVVKQGVDVGDKLIIRGLQKVRPGQTVRVQDLTVHKKAAGDLQPVLAEDQED